MGSKQFKLAIFLVGGNAVIVQTVLIRELAQVFLGTELLIGLGLAYWLLWGALGAAVFRIRSQARALTWFLALLALSAFLLAGQREEDLAREEAAAVVIGVQEP